MDSPDISVIVTCYNSENTIQRTLKSIKRQTFPNFECIVINDGSSDNSLEVIKQFSNSDSRFKVFSFNQNKGVSAAKSFGIEKSIATVIGFVDSDDYIEEFFLEKLLENKRQTGADITFCDVVEEYNYQFRYLFTYSHSPHLIENNLFLKEVIEDTKVKSWLNNKIFSRHLFEGKEFKGKTLEDFLLLPQLVKDANFISYIPFSGYHYEIRENSSSRVTSLVDKFLLLKISEKRMKWVEREAPDCIEQARTCLLNFYNSYFSAARKLNFGINFIFKEDYLQFLRRNSKLLLKSKKLSNKRKLLARLALLYQFFITLKS